MGHGYIKLHRRILDWPWYGDHNTTRLFLHLLLTANYETAVWQGVELGPGQRIISLAGLAAETGLSLRQIRTCLERLKTTHEVTLCPTHRYTVLTVVKWQEYQGGAANQTTRPATAERQQYKKLRRKNSPLPPPGEMEAGSKSAQSQPGIDYPALLQRLTASPLVQQAALGWIEARCAKGKRFAPTARAVELAFRKLKGWEYSAEQAAACFDQSAIGGYQGVFPLKEG